MRHYILWMLLALTGLASCANPKKIVEQVHINGFAGMEIRNNSNITLRFDIDNGSRKNIQLKNGQLALNDGHKTIARIKAADVTIRKRTAETVEFPMKLSLNQMQMLASMGKLANRPGELTVTGEVTVKSGMLSKKFNFADKPLPEFLKDMGLDENALKKMLEQ